MPTPLHLTFGVELEFILLGPANAGEGGQLEVYKALRDCVITDEKSSNSFAAYHLPIHDRNTRPAEITDYSKWIVSTESSLLPVDSYSDWFYGTEYQTYSIELKSRVFEFHTEHWRTEILSVLRLLHNHFNQPHSQFRMVVDTQCGLHVHVGNRRAGFPLRTVKSLLQLVTAHERCFDSLHTTQRISGDYWVEFEVMRGTMYAEPPSTIFRLNAQRNLQNDACREQPINEYSNCNEVPARSSDATNGPSELSLTRDANEIKYTTEASGRNKGMAPTRETTFMTPEEELHYLQRSKSPTEWLRLIERVQSIDEMFELVGSVQLAYNIGQLLKDGSSRASQPHSPSSSPEMTSTAFVSRNKYDLDYGDSKQTIEFRQHRGSLDAREILTWIEVVAFVTEWAHCADVHRIAQILHPTLLLDHNLDILDLFKRMEGSWWYGRPRQLPACVYDYYRRRREPTFGGKRFQRAMSRMDEHEPFYGFVEWIEARRWRQCNYTNVKGKIGNKILRGEYGDLLKDDWYLYDDGSELEDPSARDRPKDRVDFDRDRSSSRFFPLILRRDWILMTPSQRAMKQEMEANRTSVRTGQASSQERSGVALSTSHSRGSSADVTSSSSSEQGGVQLSK